MIDQLDSDDGGSCTSCQERGPCRTLRFGSAAFKMCIRLCAKCERELLDLLKSAEDSDGQ